MILSQPSFAARKPRRSAPKRWQSFLDVSSIFLRRKITAWPPLRCKATTQNICNHSALQLARNIARSLLASCLCLMIIARWCGTRPHNRTNHVSLIKLLPGRLDCYQLIRFLRRRWMPLCCEGALPRRRESFRDRRDEFGAELFRDARPPL